MLPIETQSYVPVLRLKKGEYEATGEVRPDVRRRLLPHWILTPPKEPDPEKGRPLTDEEFIFESASRLAKHWPLQPCLLDPRYLFDRFQSVSAKDWLQRLFFTAMDRRARAIPVAALSDLQGDRLAAYQSIVQPDSVGVAIRLTLSDLGDLDLRIRINAALLKLVAKPHQCILVLDLTGADLSQVGPVADYLALAYQQVAEVGLWRRVIVESTSFPETNPAAAGGQAVLPRNEWTAWHRAVSEDEELSQNLMFGDFAADSAKFVFKGGGRAIPHYRYSRTNSWFVVRGHKEVSVTEAMTDVSRRVINSELFCGRGFSKADQYIFDTASAVDGPGNAATWRKVNTVHHLTQTTLDLGTVYGYDIELASSEPPPSQPDLFGAN